ncbi:MAG: hypothetical protein CMH57_00665 [Myxococcales bacterium]|nr:hypothetical protein [Myxococcales bacterium]
MLAVLATITLPYTEAEANRGGVLYRMRRYGAPKLFNQGFYYVTTVDPNYVTSGQVTWFQVYFYQGMTYRVHALKDVDVTGNIQMGVFRSPNNRGALRVTRIVRNWANTGNFRVSNNGYYWIGVSNAGTKDSGGYIGIQYGYR